jgi:hypothetical protein
MAPSAKSKQDFLNADPDVKRWYDNISRGSQSTADVYLRRLRAVCQSFNTSPKGLASLSDAELYNLLLDLASTMEKAGHAGSYTESTVKIVKSWLSHNGKEVKRKIKIKGARETPSLKDERVPTKEELKRILLSGDKKARAACVLIAHSGLRIEVLGNYDGKDGLTVADLPQLEIRHDSVCFKQTPTMLVVRSELSKAGHRYFTFLSEEGCEYLKDYLDERIKDGEELAPRSPLITPKLKMKPFIRATNIGDSIREAIRAGGFAWRPYVLRSYFDTQLMLAESKGLVLRDYRQFWMGHKGDIENRYTTNKQRLPESVVEDMRAAYERSQDFLQTKEKESTSEEKLRDSFRKQLLLVAGLSQEEVDKLDLSSISDEELQSLVRKKLLGVPTPDSTKQKVVTVDEANGYLAKGWEYVAKVSNNRVIIKMTQSTGV